MLRTIPFALLVPALLSAGTTVLFDPLVSGYCGRLATRCPGIASAPQKIVAASVFTTMSATAWLERARAILDYVAPIVTLAQPQNTFRVSDLDSLTLHEQTGDNPAQFADLSLPLNSTLLNGLDRVVIGSYSSPELSRSRPDYPQRPDAARPRGALEHQPGILQRTAAVGCPSRPPDIRC